jgi:hypothetical protein
VLSLVSQFDKFCLIRFIGAYRQVIGDLERGLAAKGLSARLPRPHLIKSN